MIIEFKYHHPQGRGRMRVDAECMIHNATMYTYRKWAKLFVRWGTLEQQLSFLQLLGDTITDCEVRIRELEADIADFQDKADGLRVTNLSVTACLKEVRLSERKLNGERKKLKRFHTMEDLLKGLLS